MDSVIQQNLKQLDKGNKMNSYWVMVKWKDEPGAGFSRAYINADNPFQAIQMARSMYGRLLMSESANPA